MTQVSRNSFLFVLMLSLGFVLPVNNAFADSGKNQSRRLQQRVGALEQEKSQLAQEKAAMEGQLKETAEQYDQARRSIDSARHKVSALQDELKAAQNEKAELADQLAATGQKLADTEKTLADTAETLRKAQDSNTQLRGGLAQRNQDFDVCTTRNESLHRLGVVLIKEYQEKSCLTGMLQQEPLTQLKAVDIENQVEVYREKLDQELVEEAQAKRRERELQQREEEFAAIHRAEQAKAEQEQAEQARVERVKVKQQNDIDRLARKFMSMFEDVEW